MAEKEIIRVLVVEDEQEIRSILEQVLTDSGCEVLAIDSAEDLFKHLTDFSADILLLDQMLPGKSGIQALRELRKNNSFRSLPVIMVTGAGSEQEKVDALNSGADDYVTKPFLPRELAARIKAILRRGQQAHLLNENLEDGSIMVDLSAHKVFLDGSEVMLTLTEFKILVELLREKGQVLSRDQLRQRALGNLNVTDRTIDVHMASVRKKLSLRGNDIETVRGVGYRFSKGA
jgi:DNA-binding response OmpR family regulator